MPKSAPSEAPPAACPAMDLPFFVSDLKATISQSNKRYLPGQDKITYAAISPTTLACAF